MRGSQPTLCAAARSFLGKSTHRQLYSAALRVRADALVAVVRLPATGTACRQRTRKAEKEPIGTVKAQRKAENELKLLRTHGSASMVRSGSKLSGSAAGRVERKCEHAQGTEHTERTDDGEVERWRGREAERRGGGSGEAERRGGGEGSRIEGPNEDAPFGGLICARTGHPGEPSRGVPRRGFSG